MTSLDRFRDRIWDAQRDVLLLLCGIKIAVFKWTFFMPNAAPLVGLPIGSIVQLARIFPRVPCWSSPFLSKVFVYLLFYASTLTRAAARREIELFKKGRWLPSHHHHPRWGWPNFPSSKHHSLSPLFRKTDSSSFSNFFFCPSALNLRCTSTAVFIYIYKHSPHTGTIGGKRPGQHLWWFLCSSDWWSELRRRLRFKKATFLNSTAGSDSFWFQTEERRCAPLSFWWQTSFVFRGTALIYLQLQISIFQ